MEGEENLTMENLFAGVLTAVVEGKSLDEGLQTVGLSKDIVFRAMVAPQSSDIAMAYAEDGLAKQYGPLERDEETDLYLVKKVLCPAEEFEAMEKAVNGEDTEKYKVIKLIASHPQIIQYKEKQSGMEAYLTAAKTPLEALRQTNTNDPFFNFSMTWFGADEAGELDVLINNAVYEHTPEATTRLFEAIGLE